jgi:hypothetical protein
MTTVGLYYAHELSQYAVVSVPCLFHLATKHHGSEVNTPTAYLGSPGFKPQSVDQLS